MTDTLRFGTENRTRLTDRLLFFTEISPAMNYTKIKNWLQFLTVGIWRITEDEVSPIRRQLYSCIKIVYLSVDQFLNDRIQIRASALTYSTLLSIIPILAILFAIARGFGFDTLMEIQLRQGVASQQSELIISWINSYLEHAQSGIFIGIGLIMLLWTVLILTDNIERSFNAIWQVKRPRSVFRKITDYFSMILLLPLLIVISSGLTIFMTTYIKGMDNFLVLAPILKFLVRLIPYALTCLFPIRKSSSDTPGFQAYWQEQPFRHSSSFM